LVIYRYAFANFEVGYASAISWLLFGLIFFFSALQLKLFISRELY
jgi:ABC-type sugar transport system permease subunit